MILLFTDFGLAGPYIGQMKAVLAQQALAVPVIDLFADAPAFDPQLSAYLLAAYAPAFPVGSVFLCVVDPGVGTDRRPVMVEADGRWFIGPDNGLFALLARRATSLNAWTIDWIPDRLSASFHGRDLFAPVAAAVATGRTVERSPLPSAAIDRPGWPDELARIVYVDVYGNAMTGMRADALPADAVLTAAGTRIARVRTFGSVGAGEALWYGNSNGLAEIAVNRGRADRVLGLKVGDAVTVDS